MPGVQKVEHVVVRSEKPEAAVTFYTDVLGLSVVERTGSGAYLTCGVGGGFDVAVEAGGTGVERYAVGVGEARLSAVVDRLDDQGVAHEPVDGDEPGVEGGVRVSMPSGIGIELVEVEADSYRRVADPAADRAVGAPLDVDHVNLMSTDVAADAQFLEEQVGFRISDVAVAEDDHWWAAWTRFGDYHHDVAIHETRDPDETLHHVAFTAADAGHLCSLVDAVVASGIDLEVGIGRHRVGDNLFAYFWAPGGNRIELSTEMATLDDAFTRGVNGPGDETFSAWGSNHPPETFRGGS